MSTNSKCLISHGAMNTSVKNPTEKEKQGHVHLDSAQDRNVVGV